MTPFSKNIARSPLKEPKIYFLHYLHTKEGHEVDFALIRDAHIEKMIQAKYADSSIHPALVYFHEKYKIPGPKLLKNLSASARIRGFTLLKLPLS